MKETSKRSTLNFLAYVPAIVLAAYCTTGCQSTSIDYLNNPSRASLLKREIAQTQLCLDAKLPRTTEQTVERLGDSASNLAPDLVNLASRVPAAIGVDPANGRYFGRKYHQGINEDRNSYSGEPEHKGRALAIHPLNWGATALEAVGRVGKDVTGLATQAVNLSIQPLYGNSSRRSSWLDDPAKSHDGDKAREVYDGVTDIVKGPIRTALYVVDSDVTPDSLKRGVDATRNWAGYTVAEKRQEELTQKLSENKDPNNPNCPRIVVNSVPIIDKPLDNAIWGTTSRRNFGDTVATTIPDSIPASRESDWQWYRQLRGQEHNAPGVIQINKEGNPEFHPTESKLLSLLRGSWTALTSLFNRGSSTDIPTNGPTGGGSTSGWSTGQ